MVPASRKHCRALLPTPKTTVYHAKWNNEQIALRGSKMFSADDPKTTGGMPSERKQIRIDAATAFRSHSMLTNYSKCITNRQHTLTGAGRALCGCCAGRMIRFALGASSLPGCCEAKRVRARILRLFAQAEAVALPVCSFLPPGSPPSTQRLIQ